MRYSLCHALCLLLSVGGLASAAAQDESDLPAVTRPSIDHELTGQEPQPADEPATREDDRLLAIGALSAANVYTTYGYIGTVADAYHTRAYPPERVRELMTEVITLMRSSSRHMRKVREGQLIDADKKVIDDFIAVYGLLQEEAQALVDYTRTNEPRDLDEFKSARAVAWPKIKRVLGIDPDERPQAEVSRK